jgi:hypothetical protein
MSEEPAISGTRRSFNDGDWEARTVVDAGPPKQIGLVIEHTTPEGKSLATLPLTPQRARALIQLLHVMLEEVGESSGVWLTGEQPDGSGALAGESRVPRLRSIGFQPPKKSP